jgi:hypothetical protein
VPARCAFDPPFGQTPADVLELQDDDALNLGTRQRLARQAAVPPGYPTNVMPTTCGK